METGKVRTDCRVARQVTNQKYREDLRRLRNFRLMDDDFFTKCFEGNTGCMELVLRILLKKPDLVVTEVHTQVFVENLLNRSVRLDALATDGAGRKYNAEIQRSDRGAGRKRARYNSSMMDANLLKKGEDFELLPETYVIFITENDVMKKGEPLYQVERCFLKTGERFRDGTHIVYVNGAYRAETPIGRLMHDFSCTDPAEMYYDVLADRVRFFKESREGIAVMCKAMEDMRRESLQEGIREGMKKGVREGMKKGMNAAACCMLEAGKYALDEIAAVSGLSVDEVKRLQTGRRN